MGDRAIIFFTRIPTWGKTKTRLESFLSRELCTELQTAFIQDIYENIKGMGIDLLVNYSDHGNLDRLKAITDEELFFFMQRGKDLGEKMHNAISFALKDYKSCILIGSDLPLMTQRDLEIAFDILEHKDMVISPTFDGGYYLIGMKEASKDLFKMKYSSDSVFEETVEKIASMKKSYGVGSIQMDIDDKEDFLKLHQILEENLDLPCLHTRQLVEKIMRDQVK